ncbi:Noncompact Myelin-Associated Protein [Manis pentadactyla]|nr:Noncompact Myelin-Associated Protein [Manis pentadactyla]
MVPSETAGKTAPGPRRPRSHPEDLQRSLRPGGLGWLHYWSKMTTATPLGGTTFFSLNATTREEDFLYKSSGAIVAAIVVVVILIFTVVLILLKMYNRKMRTRRELEPKGPKPASPSALGPNSTTSQHPATVTFSPVDIHVETR